MRRLTKVEKVDIAQAARLELARRNYVDYCRLVHHGAWRPYRVHHFLCNKLEEVLRGDCKRLIISMPPRHGKSQTVSETFPSYYLLRNPGKKVIVTSKDDLLATKFGSLNRRKVEEFGTALFNTIPVRGESSKTSWGLSNGSTALFAPIMGGITGNGADLMIIDDPVKNEEQALSETMRDKLWEEWCSTLRTRIEGNGAVIVIMTRWHEDDFAARLIKSGGWEVVNIPCEAEENDLLGRQPGEMLCPELGYDNAWAEQTKREVGSRVWDSLYQQHPTPALGGIFKREWFKRYDVLPDNIDEWTQSWDLSFKGEKNSDFVAGGVWARCGANHYLVAIIHDRLDFIATVAKIQAVSEAYPQAIRKLIEDKANGAAVMSMLRTKLPGIVPVSPTASKEARANAVTPFFEGGNVFIPSTLAGDKYINELCSFPNAAHDDQVDQTSQYLARYIRKRTSGVGVL